MDRPRLIRVCLETLFVFGALFVVDHVLLSGTAFDGIQPNPYWIPVLMMALAYGTGPGLAASAIATGVWMAAPHDIGAAGDELQATLYLSLQPLAWVVAAVLIGEVTGSRRATIDGLQQFARETAEKQVTIAEALSRLAATNRALQVRIATDDLSLGQAMEAAAGLLERDRISQVGAVERLVALATKTDDFVYFSVTGGQPIARFRGGMDENSPANLSEAELTHHLANCLDPLDADFAASAKALASLGQLVIPAHVRGERVGMLVVRNRLTSVQLETRAAELSNVACVLARMATKIWGDKVSVVSPKWKGSKGKVA